MRLIVAASVLLLSGVSALRSSSPPVGQTEPVEAELARIEQQLAKARVDGDRGTVNSILTSDWTTIDVTGRLRTKAQVLDEMFATQSRPIKGMTIDEVKVRVLGDVAIVTGRTVAQGSDGSRVVLRFTDIFSRQDRRWRILASQGTPVAR